MANCQTVVIPHRMARCADRMKAVYFVTYNPCSPQEDETKLVAGLCGRLWVSDRFRALDTQFVSKLTQMVSFELPPLRLLRLLGTFMGTA